MRHVKAVDAVDSAADDLRLGTCLEALGGAVDLLHATLHPCLGKAGHAIELGQLLQHLSAQDTVGLFRNIRQGGTGCWLLSHPLGQSRNLWGWTAVHCCSLESVRSSLHLVSLGVEPSVALVFQLHPSSDRKQMDTCRQYIIQQAGKVI